MAISAELSNTLRPLANVGRMPRNGASSGSVAPYMKLVNATAVLAPRTFSKTRMMMATTMIAKTRYIASYARRAGENLLTTSVPLVAVAAGSSYGPPGPGSSRTIRSSLSIAPLLYRSKRPGRGGSPELDQGHQNGNSLVASSTSTSGADPALSEYCHTT